MRGNNVEKLHGTQLFYVNLIVKGNFKYNQIYGTLIFSTNLRSGLGILQEFSRSSRGVLQEVVDHKVSDHSQSVSFLK